MNRSASPSVATLRAVPSSEPPGQGQLARSIEQALSEDQFALVFQPSISLTTGRVTSCEALIRWQHPVYGLLRPGDFLPVAEDAGLMPKLGEWIIRSAIAETLAWPADVNVAVNISASQIQGGQLLLVIANALAAGGISPDRLELEVTETTPNPQGSEFWDTLRKVQALGVSIAVDDFGVGYSSLARLRDFTFDRVKIDRSFVARLPGSTGCAAIVRSIVGLANDLGMETTAEGAETQAQVQLLAALGCTDAQGFFFSPAWPSSGIRDFLNAQTQSPGFGQR
jgi:EAL domain-containing protein (putative c-di-GMP-specific phosphodiesterase class I)